MKKLLLSILTCLAILPVGATNLEELTGSYTGILNVTLGEGDAAMPMPPTENVKVYTYKEDGKNTLKLVLKDFSFMNGAIMVGDIEVPSVAIDEQGVITAPEIIIDKTEVGLGQLPTTLNGTLTKDKANLIIRVLWNDSPVNVTFDGDKDLLNSLTSAVSQIKTIYADNVLTVSGAEITGYKIFTINGSVIANQRNQISSIDMNQYSYGVYLIEITTNHGIITRKVYRK
ncbi:MAG: calycin-like domain-containing protein [Bacteroidales bacterium]